MFFYTPYAYIVSYFTINTRAIHELLCLVPHFLVTLLPTSTQTSEINFSTDLPLAWKSTNFCSAWDWRIFTSKSNFISTSLIHIYQHRHKNIITCVFTCSSPERIASAPTARMFVFLCRLHVTCCGCGRCKSNFSLCYIRSSSRISSLACCCAVLRYITKTN